MLHLGDITKINGEEAPVVDCIIGGSPCQDLSITKTAIKWCELQETIKSTLDNSSVL